MSSSSLLNLDGPILEQANLLGEIDVSDHPVMLAWAIDILEGKDIADAVSMLATRLGLSSPAKLVKTCTALATLIWECSKVVMKNTASLPGLLVQVGVSEAVVPTFCQAFVKSKGRIAALKGSLGLDVMSYKDLAWRLDIELGRRSLLSIMEPMFQLRLDLANNAAVQSERSERSHHIQADYANLKLLQTELQRAVDEYAGVHNQRVSRYIS